MTKFNKLFGKIINECHMMEQLNNKKLYDNSPIQYQPETQQETNDRLQREVAFNNANYNMYQNDAAGFTYQSKKSKLLKETKGRRKRLVKEGLFTGDNNFSVNFSGNDICSNNDTDISDNNTDLSLPIPMESRKSKLLKETKGRRKRLVKEGLFTGDNNFSVNFNNNTVGSNNDIDASGNNTDLSLPFAMECNKKITKQSSVVMPDEIVKCEICGKDITRHVTYDKHYGTQYESEEMDFSCDDPNFMHEHICLDCAEKEAQKYQNAFINGTDSEEHVLEFTDNNSNGYNMWKACVGCGTLYPEDELRDTDEGPTCDDCIDGYVSRGEEVSIHYNRY